MITLLYSGNVGIGQDVNTVLHAVARLKGSGNLRTLIVGTGRGLPAAQELVRELQLEHVEFRPPVPLHRLAKLLAAGDIHVICQKPGTEGLLVPSKIYGTLAAGRPSLFIGPAHCEVSRIVAESQSGFVVEEGDVEGCAHALTTLVTCDALREEMSRNARKYYEKHFGRQRSVAKIIDIIERVGRNGGSRGGTAGQSDDLAAERGADKDSGGDKE